MRGAGSTEPISRQEFEAVHDDVEDLIRRMAGTENRVDVLTARVLGIATGLKRLDEIEARLKRFGRGHGRK